MRQWMRASCVVFLLTSGAAALTHLTFDDFEKQRVARVTGVDLRIPGKRCVYYEWVIGKQEAGEYTTFQVGYHSDSPLHLSISGQGIDLPAGKMRPFLAPTVTVLGKPEDAPAYLREGVRDFIREHGESVLSEYCIEYGKAYHALLHVDSYLLPPGPEGKPEPRTNKILYIAETAFKDGLPPAALTPAYRGWTY